MHPQAVVEVMGGPAALHGPVRGLADLRAEITEGFPSLCAAEYSRACLCRRGRPEALAVPRPSGGSYKRRAKTGQLTLGESERDRAARLRRSPRRDVWRDRDGAREFLTARHPELGDRLPIEVAVDEFGARHVEEILMGILHGMPA